MLSILLFIILFIAASAIMELLGTDKREKVMNDFCNMECKQSIKKKYKFCC
ncbi:hypothetical protein Desmer_3008 [Desulfosporosinus meridiei DSM 13257]|uniref:Uncharacterized protein n=1 Tax=Desulfosporosinus meridiei (strain ATCC BAA-275 / DSM 13257 / KCTC 12902 / NCIMB 13706 / S10) TaxID=768704 RepID=J7IT71_DESMD|nr:hypothetical protein Desmer_3008 [Desulfosporosinus meridiei DSM 13257]